MALWDRPHRWGREVVFFIDIYKYMSSYNLLMPIPSFSVPQGR
jgi:hypothetical protein